MCKITLIATLSLNKIASVTWRVTELLNSRATPITITAALYSVQLCRENSVNADWSIIVYATKLQSATRHVTLAILLRDKVTRQNCAIKLQVWHRSKSVFLWEVPDRSTLIFGDTLIPFWTLQSSWTQQEEAKCAFLNFTIAFAFTNIWTLWRSPLPFWTQMPHVQPVNVPVKVNFKSQLHLVPETSSWWDCLILEIKRICTI